MKNNDLKEPAGSISYGRLVFEAIPELFSFQLLSSILLGAAAWVLKTLITLVAESGGAAITTANLGDLLLSWRGPAILLLGAVLVAIFAAFEIFAGIYLYDDILNGRTVRIFSEIGQSFRALRRFLCPGGLLVLRGSSGGYDSRYLQLDERHILLPDFEGGAVWLEYYRRPERVTDRIAPGEKFPNDDLLLDNAPETHRAIPYYAAAHLLLHEDAFAYATLMNEWQTQLLSLYRKPQPRRSVVADAYQWEALHV